MKPLIYDLDLPDLEQLLENWGQPKYRAKQIWQGLYQQFWSAADQFSTLPVALRKKLNENVSFEALNAGKFLESQDGETRKTLFRLHDNRQIEAVLMRYDRRRTLCISTQVGCAMGCTFCATGQMGFTRHLSSGEIAAQVIFYARQLAAMDERVTNVVIMGMGEPFHNYQNTLAAIDRLNHPDGYNFGARRFTVSTVGLVPAIRKFADENRQVNLAISLHAADDLLRQSMLPIDKRYPIAELIEACRYYIEKTNRRITFEWALVHGVNDTPEQAHRLTSLLSGMLCHVNLIPLNPTAGYEGQGTSAEKAERFANMLEEAGIPVTLRIRRGIDIQAGCGQLAISE